MKITHMVTRAIALAGACFMGLAASATTYYASPAGGGYGTSAKDSTTLDAAVAAATEEGDVVILADGTYERTTTLVINKAITVRGTSREDTIITRGTTSNLRLIELRNASAVLRDMTVQNGRMNTGANILLNFGTVENCIVQGGYCWDNGIGGSAIAVYDGANSVKSSGTIRNCIIRNNLSVPNGNEHSGYAIWCRKTDSVLIEGCQFYDNKERCNKNSFVGTAALGVYSDGYNVVVRNCTFARNEGIGGGAIWSDRNTTIISNCVFASNRARRETADYRDVKGSFKAVTYCAFEDTLPSKADKNTCVAGVISFRDAANNDFTPLAYDNVAVGAGAQGETVGAITTPSNEGCVIHSSITAAHAVPFTATFTGASAGTGAYSWNFGDGSTVETGKEVSHTFTTAGKYTVTLTIGDATQTATIDARVASIDVASVAEITQAVADAGDGTVINVAPGTYTFTSGTIEEDFSCGATALYIRKGLTLRGAAGNPIQTIFKVGNNTFVSDATTGVPDNHPTKLRLIMLEHPDARVENLTLFGGAVDGVYYYGAGAFIDYDGGTISNCSFTACSCQNNQSGGAGVGQYGGLVTHCWITNNYSKVDSNDYSGGNALLFQRGVLRNSLIVGNRAYSNITKDGKTYNTGGVSVDGKGLVENCTIANNKGLHTGGVRTFSANAIVRNCQIQANEAINYPVNGQYCANKAANFVNCVSTVEITGGTNCKKGNLAVADAAHGDWHPVLGSEALEAGLVQDWMTGATDIDGNARLSDEGKVDAGCYQFVKAAVSGSFSLSKSDGTIPATVEFKATIESEIGEVTSYIWDFGDGSEVVTTNSATVTHVYTTLGVFKPMLKVGIGGKQYAIASALTMTAGPSVEYVVNAAENPNEAYPYGTWETATTNLQTAIDAAVTGTRIVLSTGVHTNDFTATVAKGIVIEGETANPNDTVVYRRTKMPGGWVDTISRTLYLDHADAVVRNLTLRGGAIYYATTTYGGNVYITGTGGTITNCYITEGQIGGSQPNASAGSAIAQFGGLVTHCVISNNWAKLSSNDNGTGGSTIHMGGGRLEFSLVTCNRVNDSELQSWLDTYKNNFSRIVAISEGTMANCTIVSNDVMRGWTVSRSIDTDKAKIVNCLIAHNNSSNTLAGCETARWFRQTSGISTLAVMDHCAGEMTATALPGIDETKFLCDTNLAFKVTAEAPWQPKMGLHDAARHAKATPEMEGATYLDGTPVPARHAAIGCYPAWGRGTIILVK